MVAEVLINENVKELNKTFDYNIPKELEKDLKIGSRVLVVFNFRKIDGFVLNIKEKSHIKKLSNINEIIASDDLSKDKIELAKYMSKKYFASLSSCVKLMLNPGIVRKTTIIKKQKEKAYIINKKVLDLYNNDFKKYRKILNENLNINITENHFKVIKYFKEKTLEKEYRLELEEVGFSQYILKTMIKNNVLEEIEEEKREDENLEIEENEKTKKLKLNKEQKIAFDQIIKAVEKKEFEEFLLFGVTGSGKTEVYMQVIEEVIKKGKTAIMLVPEIGLTPQMEKVFSKRFGANISIMHSRLTQKERFNEWENIKKGEKKIVIGTRSAIFSPLKNIGVIIIDEEHDFSYISQTSPRYDAKEIARYIAKKTNSVYISGSATPLVTSMYDAKRNKRTLLTIKKRVSDVKLPDIEIVDMKLNHKIFSDKLINYLIKNMEENKQSIIFLNRRGFSNFVICKECGEVLKCPNCSINLTYHKNSNSFKCHYCGHKEKNTNICRECGADIIFPGIGTQKVKEELEKIFLKLKEEKKVKREITTLIMDQDSVTASGGHKEIIDKFTKENIDVLIGTQMVSKGHHFPNVNLVAVLLADSIINTDSYNGSEIGFQTLVQVMGRSGREEDGKAIIQTYNPDHYIIELAKKNDYISFYNLELDIRENLKYPPFTDILTFQVFSKDNLKVQEIGRELEFKLKKYLGLLKDQLEKQYIKFLKLKLKKEENKEKGKEKDKDKEKKELKLEKYIKRYREELDKIIIFDLAPYKIDKINKTYRWKIIMKARFNNIIGLWIKDILNSIKTTNKVQINLLINGID